MMPPEAAPPLAFNTTLSRLLNGWRARLGAGAKASVAPTLVVAAFIIPPPGASAEQGGRLLGIPSLCLFYQFTGLPCPGCGITRACVCFAHGEWAESLAYHALGPLTFLVLCFFAVRPLLLAVLPGLRCVRVSERVPSAAAYVATSLFIAVWIARLCHILPPLPTL